MKVGHTVFFPSRNENNKWYVRVGKIVEIKHGDVLIESQGSLVQEKKGFLRSTQFDCVQLIEELRVQELQRKQPKINIKHQFA